MPSNGKFVPVYGWGLRTQRGWGRPEQISLLVEEELPRRTADISFSLVSGGAIGKIQTNVEDSIVRDLSFTVDEHGSADFTISLLREPDFNILPNSIVKFRIGKSAFSWYCGTIDYPEEISTGQDVLVYKGFGLRKYLSELSAPTTYTAAMLISAVVDDIVQNWISPYCPISYNASKIDVSTGSVLANNIELGKYKLPMVLDTLALQAQGTGYYYAWGVDGDGDFYFKKITTTTPVRTYFVGYNAHDFKPKLNFNEIKNVITLTRKELIGTGNPGWKVAGVYNAPGSVKKYGRMELTYPIPGYYAIADADILGAALRDNLSEPTYAAQVSGINAWEEINFFTPGIYRFILPKVDDVKFQTVLDDLDDNTVFTISGAGDLAKADDVDQLVWSAGSVRFDFQNAINQVAEMSINASGYIRGLNFYLRATKPMKVRIGAGVTNWNDYTQDFYLPADSNFYELNWDLSVLALESLTKFGIQILSNEVNPESIWIDRLAANLTGHRTYRLKFLRAKFNYSPEKSDVACDFGGIPPSLIEYAAALQRSATELKFTGEIV